jgi:hypothetical protein
MSTINVWPEGAVQMIRQCPPSQRAITPHSIEFLGTDKICIANLLGKMRCW